MSTSLETPVGLRSQSTLGRPMADLEVVASLTELQNRGKVPVSRFIHAAAEVGGKIYLTGGRDKSGTSLKDCFVYDPISAKCSEISELPSAICGHSMISYESKLYTFGGYDGKVFNSDVLMYDPKGNKWSTVWDGKLGGPSARFCHGAVVRGETMYIAGGDNHKDNLAELWAFNLESYKWSVVSVSGSAKPDGRQGLVMSCYNDCLYTFGGFCKASNTPSNELWKFDLEKGVWTLMKCEGAIPNARHGHSAVVYGDSWIIHGGRKDHGEKYNVDVYDYQFDSNKWSRLGVVQHAASPWGCPAVRFGHQAVLEPYTNAVIITGGYTHSDGVNFCPTSTMLRLDLIPTLHSLSSLHARVTPLEDLSARINATVQNSRELEDTVIGFEAELESNSRCIKELEEKLSKFEMSMEMSPTALVSQVEGVSTKLGDVEKEVRSLQQTVEESSLQFSAQSNSVAEAKSSASTAAVKSELALQKVEGAYTQIESMNQKVSTVVENYEKDMQELGELTEQALSSVEECKNAISFMELRMGDVGGTAVSSAVADAAKQSAESVRMVAELQLKVEELSRNDKRVRDLEAKVEELCRERSRDSMAEISANLKHVMEVQAHFKAQLNNGDVAEKVERVRQIVAVLIKEQQKIKEAGRTLSGMSFPIMESEGVDLAPPSPPRAMTRTPVTRASGSPPSVLRKEASDTLSVSSSRASSAKVTEASSFASRMASRRLQAAQLKK